MSAETLVIKGGTVLTPFVKIDRGIVRIHNGKIAKVGRRISTSSASDVIDASGMIVAPGFVDTHVHGGRGFDIMDGTIEAVGQIAQYHALFGTTSMLATTTTDSLDRITKAVRATRRFIETGTGGANVIGIHLEGPYINSEEGGAQNVEHVRSPSISELRRILEESGDLVRIVTLAPEAKGALGIIAALRDRSIVASAGHSNATYAEMVSAIEAGITHVTHIFNGMRKFHHREPGIIGAALTRQELTVSVIADGIHVHPSAVRLLFGAKGADDIVLISDAIRAAGMSDGSYDLGGLAVTVTNGVCRLASGTLAGSTLTLNTALRNVVNFLGVPLSDALKMTSANPARVIGFGHSKGALEEGKDADIVILDEDLNVRNTIVRGRIITGI